MLGIHHLTHPAFLFLYIKRKRKPESPMVVWTVPHTPLTACNVQYTNERTHKFGPAVNIFVFLSRLCQLPASLLQYPVKAIKVKLAGFKPPKEDFQADRLQYCPEWSIKALFEMIDLVQKKTLSATCVVRAFYT